MAFPVILSKLKALTPVGVVGLAVAVTIKLLTQATPTNSQLFQVKADEDIMQVEEHKEELVEEEPEEEKEEEEDASDTVQEAEEAEVEEDIPEEENQGDGEAQQKDQSEADEKQKKQEEDEEKKSENRAFKGSGPVIDIFKALLSPEQ